MGYNDEVIDVKSLPSGAGRGGWGEAGESWVAVATNSPQVMLDWLTGCLFGRVFLLVGWLIIG